MKFTENIARETSRFGINVFSVHPGLLAIGLGETGLPDDAPTDPYVGHIRTWVMHELAAGRGGDPMARCA